MLGWLSLLAAVAAFGTASLLQAIGARHSPSDRTGRQFLGEMATSWQYSLGTALDLVGVLLTALALRSLPLFLVQATTSSSLLVTALGSALLFPAERRPGLWRLVFAVSLGLALLGSSAAEGASNPMGRVGIALLCCGMPLLFGARLLLQRTSIAPSISYAVLAGSSYAGLGVSLRALHVPSNAVLTITEPVALIAAGYLVLALMFFARAMQHGAVTETMAIVVSIDTIVPAGVGVWLLGDRPRAGGAGIAAAGLVLTVGALIRLLRTMDARQTPDRPASTSRKGAAPAKTPLEARKLAQTP